MTDTSTHHLGLPYIAAAQAQKHVTLNEALRALDAIVMLAVDDRDLSAPPGSPAEGARYLVKPTGTGAFAGKDNQIAHYRDGAFAFHAPRAGWIVYVADETAILIHDGTAWVPLLGAAPHLQNVARLGLATAADAANPFSARLNDALWTARAVADGGDGNLRSKLSKEAAANTASLLFQTGLSGRAEIGLTGDDDLHVKVSADGSAWHDGLTIARATGKVSFPQGVVGLRDKLTAARTYYVRTDGSDTNDGLGNAAGSAFRTIQKAVDVVFGTLDLGGFDVTIQVADGIYNESVVRSAPQVGAGAVVVQGNAATPANVDIRGVSGAYVFSMRDGAALAVKDVKISHAVNGALQASRAAFVSYSNIVIGACIQHQIRADDLGRIICAGNYSIAGGGQSHWCSVGGGVIRCQSKTITLTGAPAFSAGFVNNQIGGASIVNGNTFSVGATGPRYAIDTNAVAYVGGASATYLPGDASGTAASGAQYT